MCRTNQYYVINKDKNATIQMNLKHLNLMLLKSTTRMNKPKRGYTRTIGKMQGSIKATEIENILKTDICQSDIHYDENVMT